jgi:hypothetical protein
MRNRAHFGIGSGRSRLLGSFAVAAALPLIALSPARLGPALAGAREAGSEAATIGEASAANPFQSEDTRARFLRVWKPRIEDVLAQAGALPVPEEPYLPPDIKDPVFGYLIGMFDRKMSGFVTGDHLQAVLEASDRKSRVPREQIKRVLCVRENRRDLIWARAEFVRDLRLPVPYSILGYHPGRLVSSAAVTARQWEMERMVVPYASKDEADTLEIKDVTLLAFVEGGVEMDIDGWLDALMGDSLDDTYMLGLAVFRYNGTRYAMALGYNSKGEPRSGALHLSEDEVRFPTPDDLKAVARYLRKQMLRKLTLMELPVALPAQASKS